MTVTTTANAAAANWIPRSLFFGHGFRAWLPISTAALLALMVATHSRKRTWLYVCTLVVGLMLAGAATTSCGGGGGSGNTTPVTPVVNGTPAGNYTVTVYAFTESNTKDGSNSNADANVAIQLTVN